MKRIKTLTNKTLNSTVVKGGCGECRHHASQHVRLHVQLEIRAARISNLLKQFHT